MRFLLPRSNGTNHVQGIAYARCDLCNLIGPEHLFAIWRRGDEEIALCSICQVKEFWNPALLVSGGWVLQ